MYLVKSFRTIRFERCKYMLKLTERPASTAFLANKPAPNMTLGLLVFVQLVIAAITTEPCPIRYFLPSDHVNSPKSCNRAGARPKPLNPT